MTDDIFLKLIYVHYLTNIDASCRYHNLHLDENSSNLLTFNYQFGSYRYVRLLFDTVPSGDMFQRQIEEIFNYITILALQMAY